MKHLYELLAFQLKEMFIYLDSLSDRTIFICYAIAFFALYLLSNRVKKQSKN